MTHLTYQSFRLLLNLEWLLLATVLTMEVLLPFQPSWTLLGRVVAIIIFGLMGLRFPTRLPGKLVYMASGFGLIGLAALQEGLSNRSVLLLCLVLVMRGCLLFERIGQLVILALSILLYSALLLIKPINLGQIAIWDWRFSHILLFSLTLLFALLLINALLAERQSREQLEIAHRELALTHAQLRQYTLRIEDQATLQERNRIAREIHDGLGHKLAAQTIQLNNALLFWANPDQAIAFLKQAKELGSEALLEVRKSVSVLRSNPLQGQRLETALEKLLADFQQNTGIAVTRQIQPVTLPLELNLALFRIVQESLTNIAKHAQATAITVALTAPQAGSLELLIADDGKGFDPTQNTTGCGLQGMRERATALGGRFTVESQPGAGCQIRVAFPLLSGYE